MYHTQTLKMKILFFSQLLMLSIFWIISVSSTCAHPESEFCEDVLVGISTNSADTKQMTPITVENFKCIMQEPELPTGCEITAMTMLLNYYGFDVSKVTMARDYLPTLLDFELPYDMYDSNPGSERITGPDLEHYFLGDPFTECGIVCGTSALVTAANTYLATQDTDLMAVDLSGITCKKLYTIVEKGQPVMLLTTISMEDRQKTMGWYTSDHTYVEWSHNDHGTVIIGCSEDSVVIADPLEGIQTYKKDLFERIFAERGYRAVVLEKTEPVKPEEKEPETEFPITISEVLVYHNAN